MPQITVPDFSLAPIVVQTLPAVGVANATGSLPVTIASNDPLLTGTNTIAVNSALAATAALQTTNNAALGTLTGLVATSANQVTTNNSLAIIAAASATLQAFRLIVAASTNATLVKATAGSLYAVIMSNNAATNAYIKFYNSSAIPTAGVGTPVLVLMVPASTTVTVPIDLGWVFSAGIGFTITGATADADTTAVAATMLINLAFK